jgi:ATP-dependent DNA helicase RecG
MPGPRDDRVVVGGRLVGSLAALVQRTEAETRSLLPRMVERGWMQARGDGKGRTWHLSAALYRVLDAPAGYVRVRGFEPLQQEQMILQFVDAHGHITRHQAAELCSLRACLTWRAW